MMLPSDASLIHKKVAESIERSYASNLRPFYCMLSYHYAMHGKCRTKAFEFIVKAADQQISQGAFCDGFVYLQHANELREGLEELNVLISVTDAALYDMNPRLPVHRVPPFGAFRLFSAMDIISTKEYSEYNDFVTSLRQVKMDWLTQADRTRKKRSTILYKMSDSFSTPSNEPKQMIRERMLHWQPSYAHDHANKMNSCCTDACIIL